MPLVSETEEAKGTERLIASGSRVLNGKALTQQVNKIN
jgi:hypothetical protein